jgi:UDP-glucose 4-epimerase
LGVRPFQPIVLITGATGALGPSVVAAFAEAGFKVRTFSRSAPEAISPSSNIECFTGDIASPSAIELAIADVQVVVHLAGLLHIVNPSASLRSEYERINVQGTANVTAAALKAGVDRLVFSSTIAVYGDSHGQVLNEDTAPKPQSIYAKTKLASEEIVLKARTGKTPMGSVLRLAAVYGPRLKGNYRRLVHSLARNRFVPLGDGNNRRTVVYDKDAAQAILLAATRSQAAGRVYNVADAQVHTLNQIIRAICDSLGKRPPRLSIPVAPARAMIGVFEDSAQIIGWQLPIGRETIDKYTEDTAVESRRIQDELGFEPRFDLFSGWKETIDLMRLHGEI